MADTLKGLCVSLCVYLCFNSFVQNTYNVVELALPLIRAPLFTFHGAISHFPLFGKNKEGNIFGF